LFLYICKYIKDIIYSMQNHKQVIGTNDCLFTMIAVEGTTFEMGGESWNNQSSMPIHKVQISDFWIGEYPVTQELWELVMGKDNNPSYFKSGKRPVEQVSWKTINDEFLPKLNVIAKESILKLNYTDNELFYRLPTEAEWECAAKGGNKSKNILFSTDNKLDEFGWNKDNSHGETKPVGLKIPNELGIFDMIGNVWE
jgi:formylglycine-generating enzyme